MKVKELIEELQKCSQDAVVSCGNNPVFFVEEKVYYWDGYNAEVKWDDNEKHKKWIYNTTNNKVCIYDWDPNEFLFDHMGLIYHCEKRIPTWEECLKLVENVPESSHEYVNDFKVEYEKLKKMYERIKEKEAGEK